MNAELMRLSRDLLTATEELEQSFPSDPTPFGKMARLFGAAASVMNAIREGGADTTTGSAVLRKTGEMFRNYSDEEIHTIVALVLQYNVGRTAEDRSAWDVACQAKERLYALGWDSSDRQRAAAVVVRMLREMANAGPVPTFEEVWEELVKFFPGLQ